MTVPGSTSAPKLSLPPLEPRARAAPGSPAARIFAAAAVPVVRHAMERQPPAGP